MGDIDHVVLSDISEVNPPTDLHGLDDNAMVSFIPMADVSESGEWTNQQARPLKNVRNGYTSFQEDDILFAKITPCMENGKGAHATDLLNGIGFGTTEFHILRAKSRVHVRFIYHWIMNEELRRKAEAQMTGSAGQRRVPASFFGEFEVPFLPLPEQRRIVEILDTIDEAIQKTESLISKLKAMKQGLLHDLLTRGLDENGKLRDLKAHSEQFRDSPLGGIPKVWEVEKLGDVCQRSGGSVQTGPFGSQLHAKDYKDSGIPIITVEHLGDNEIIHNNLPLVGSMDYERLGRYRLVTGDLVFSRVGAIDRCVYVSEQENGWLFSGRCLRVRTGGKLVNPSFLSFQLNSYASRKWILNHAVGSTMACLNTAILSEVPVSLPAIQEQRAIALLLDAHDACIRTEEQYRDKLKLQKKGLMQDLLTGKVRVKV